MDREIINKLFLELSQFATARTQRETELEEERNELIDSYGKVQKNQDTLRADLAAAMATIKHLKRSKTTAFAIERDAYMREVEKWKAIYLKAVEGEDPDDRWVKAAEAFELQHNIIINILTDSQLDTKGPCGKTLREYQSAVEILLGREGEGV